MAKLKNATTKIKISLDGLSIKKEMKGENQ